MYTKTNNTQFIEDGEITISFFKNEHGFKSLLIIVTQSGDGSLVMKGKVVWWSRIANILIGGSATVSVERAVSIYNKVYPN